MMMDQHTVDYVSSLPAVESATNDRITYTDEFKHRIAAGYRNGQSPVAMFRAAGLGPELIGYKRIERCVARWRTLEPGSDGTNTVTRDMGRHESVQGAAPMSVILAQEARINGLEERLAHVTEILRGLGVEA